MKILYAGSPEFAVPALEKLMCNHEIVGLLCQPDKPKGRGKKVLPPPTKIFAQDHNIPVYQPASLKDPALQEELMSLDADVFVVCAYGKIIPESLLYMYQHHALNIHASILPRWRGAAPIERAILAGDTQTGVCIMKMEKGLDTGPVLLEKRMHIESRNSHDLTNALSRLGADAMLEDITLLEEGSYDLEEQPLDGVTYAHKIEKSEFKIDFTKGNEEIIQHINAFYPRAECVIDHLPVKVLRAEVVSCESHLVPGTIISNGKAGLDVATGSGGIRILDMQMVGKKPCAWSVIRNGYSNLFTVGKVFARSNAGE